MFVRIGTDGDALYDLQSVSLQPHDLARVVGEEADFFDSEISQDLGASAVVAEVGRKTEFLVGLDGVESLLLKLVGMDFGGKSDAATLLTHVDKDSVAVFGNLSEGTVKLAAAIAAP